MTDLQACMSAAERGEGIDREDVRKPRFLEAVRVVWVALFWA